MHCDWHIWPAGQWVTECIEIGNLDDVKKINTLFPTLLSRVTVADKLVLVNPFWWNNHFFIVSCVVYSLFKVDLYSARHWLQTSTSVTSPTNIILYRTLWSLNLELVYEKKNGSLVFSGSRKIPTLWSTGQWETQQSSFPTGTMGPRVGIFLSPLDTNDGFYLSYVTTWLLSWAE